MLTLWIGWYSSRFVKTSGDFVLAGRKMPVFVVASGLFATWFGSETVMGASSEFLENGVLGVIEDPFGASLCLLLTGLFFARPLYKLNIYTFSDYFGMRYNKRAELTSAFFMIPSYFGWIAAQLVALAVILEAVADIPFAIGVIICAVVVLFYTYIGGMWSVSITDTIQTVMIIGGMVILAADLYIKAGGWQPVYVTTPQGFFRFTPRENTSVEWLAYFAAWITIGLGSIPQQDVFQRVLSANSEKTAVRGAVISSFMYLTVAMLPLVIALCGTVLYPDVKGENHQMAIPNLVLLHTNIGMQVLFFGALLSAILSTCSAAVLAPATVVAENIIRPVYGDNIKDEVLLRIMRYSTVLVTFVAVTLAFNKSNIYELVGESSALSLVALFVPLAAGLYWKKSTPLGAVLAMFSGTLVWITCLWLETEVSPMLWGFMASITGMITGTFIARK